MKKTMMVIGAWMTAAVLAQAGVPEPSFRYYGTVRNEFGWPATADDSLALELRAEDRLIARSAVRSREGSGVNFMLEAPCDSGHSATQYAAYAVRSGEQVSVRALDGDTEVPVVASVAIPPVGAAGDAVRVDIQLGTDTAGDGLPDRWKMLIVNHSSKDAIQTLADVRPEDDFDGDGASNADEFRAGTSPVFAGDVFQLLDFMRKQPGLAALCFTTTKGFSYRVTASASLEGGEWKPVSFRLTPDGPSMQSYTETQSAARYFYIEFDEPMSLFRLEQL